MERLEKTAHYVYTAEKWSNTGFSHGVTFTAFESYNYLLYLKYVSNRGKSRKMKTQASLDCSAVLWDTIAYNRGCYM